MKEHDEVVLTRDLPDEKLVTGDVGTIVAVYEGGAGYEVEFMTLDGDTVAVTTVGADGIRAIRPLEIPHARSMA